MRTTLDLPEALLAEAQQKLGGKTKTETITFALRNLVREKRINELIDLMGKIHFDIDIDKFRERPTPAQLRRARARASKAQAASH